MMGHKYSQPSLITLAYIKSKPPSKLKEDKLYRWRKDKDECKNFAVHQFPSLESNRLSLCLWMFAIQLRVQINHVPCTKITSNLWRWLGTKFTWFQWCCSRIDFLLEELQTLLGKKMKSQETQIICCEIYCRDWSLKLDFFNASLSLWSSKLSPLK